MTREFIYTCIFKNVRAFKFDLNVDVRSICQTKNITLNKMSIVSYYSVKMIFVGKSWAIFQKTVN